ncbi:DUF927 domain-containing protein [Sporosarcina sp. JAI121]|uniref:DUF927 domain-containing protein n=1 Tax=Sporosarcina sp. JAI121 TaxID=2723064 RepID=UPI0015CC71BE|nr:DUF927 domain-containing protein [Sporosarcina sp. JAI121]NYF23569.1 uncharacterized protein (DUF927 family) [Sporosarcina sp. JAI121]
MKKTITIEALQNGKTFGHFPYEISKDGLFVQRKNEKTEEISKQRLCDPIFVKEMVQNMDTKEVTINLCYFFQEQYHEWTIGMGQLIPNELLKLSSKGMNIPFSTHKAISDFLMSQQKTALHRELYQDVGWHIKEDETIYFRHENVHPKKALFAASNDTENGLYNLAPAGTLNAWLEMIRNHVEGNVKLEFIVCAGFSSVIVGYLSKFYDDVDSLLIHLAGDSTRGKTTAALLAVSAFGMPSNKKRGLMKTWNGTANATINMMSGNYGIPIIFDELSMSKSKSLTSEVYVLTSGQEKSRLTDQMTQRKQGTWSTTIFSTGEQSIFERTSQNVGLTVRAFELSNVSWTTSAENADAIRKVIQDNYGHAGIAFLDYLFAQELSVIEKTWEQWQSRCIEELEETPFRSRIAKKYALILAAGDLMNRALGLSLDIEGVLAFLVEQEKERASSRDIGGKALHYITQVIIQHQQNFKREGSFGSPPNCWGKFIPHGTHIEVAILKNILEEQLRGGGFEDPKVILRDWDEKGLLVTESDRRTKRTRIFGDDEQDARQKMVGKLFSKSKASDTTYNIMLDKETHLCGMIYETTHPAFQVET